MVRKKESFKTNDAVGDRSIIEDDDDEDGKVGNLSQEHLFRKNCRPRFIGKDLPPSCQQNYHFKYQVVTDKGE